MITARNSIRPLRKSNMNFVYKVPKDRSESNAQSLSNVDKNGNREEPVGNRMQKMEGRVLNE